MNCILFLAFLFSVVYSSENKPVTTHFVTFDIEIGSKPAGQLKIHLFSKVAPKTVKNFYLLSEGFETDDGKLLSYTNSIFHRVIDKFMIQGGDITEG
jgi:peptidylprolyl isomerase